MSTVHKLSLFNAILININVMLGTGIFINTAELAKRAGVFGSFGYILIGILMLPLIFSMAHLLRIHPEGNFYTFGSKELHPYLGFVSAWGYFTGKLAAASLMIHLFVTLMCELIPSCAIISPYMFDVLILSIFVALNMLNIKLGSVIQACFMSLKSIPILLVTIAGFWFVIRNGMHLNTAVNLNTIQDFATILPLVLYATVGFEVACSLSGRIENAQRNAPRAIFISYGVVICAAFLYQFLFYGVLGPLLGTVSSYQYAFPAFVQIIFSSSMLAHVVPFVTSVVYACIALSALGAAYGILFSNLWNLYALATHGHVPAKNLLTSFNRHSIPWACVLVEGVFCLLYLAITRGVPLPLQQLSALGSSIAFTISALALWFGRSRAGYYIPSYVPFLALCNCTMLGISCLYSIAHSNMYALGIFGVFFVAGTASFLLSSIKKDPANTNAQ